MVIVEKSSLRGKALKGEPIRFRFVGEGQIAVVDEDLVRAIELLVTSHSAHEDVEIAVAVDIGHGYACRPVSGACDAGPFRDVFKSKVALVQVQFVGCLVRSKVDIGEPVVVDVADSDATAIEKIQVFNDVEVVVGCKPVFKCNAGLRRRQGIQG